MDTLGYIEVLVRVLWVAGAVCFVLGLVRMNSPATARNGNLLSAGGMVVAIAATAFLLVSQQLLDPAIGGIKAVGWIIIVLGIALGGGLGLYTARTVKMTAMPQLVSLFNAVGGGAAARITTITATFGVPVMNRMSAATTVIAARASVTRRPPGIRIGLPGTRPWSLPDATSDPENVIDPMMMSRTTKMFVSSGIEPPAWARVR